MLIRRKSTIPDVIAPATGALVVVLLAVTSSIMPFEPVSVAAQHSNANLLVSAENPAFGNYFAGSMVVEVIVAEPAQRDTGSGSAGEPAVSVNGATLRMAQARDGYWYGYFANLDAAQNADQISHDAGVPGQGLDFGVFCASSTPESVLGVSFSDSDGVAVPRSAGLTLFSNGNEPLSACNGAVSLTSASKINNVVRSPPSLVSNDDSTAGQIGLSQNAWPVVQLFSFSGDVRVQYDRGGSGTQQVALRYGDIPSISFATDRGPEPYPARAAVILQVNDMQLNQDPTDEDSWTFGVSSGSPSVFYQAFYHGGRTAADGGAGLVDLYPYLERLGFDKNGYIEIERDGVLELRQNKNQPANFISDGDATYGDIVTLVERGSNSGLFASLDTSNISSLYISSEAPRGTSAVIMYNGRSLSVLTGSYTASLLLDRDDESKSNVPIFDIDPTGWRSGVRIPIMLQDHDQNVRPNMRDDLDVFRDTAIIPSIRIGSPLTLSASSSVVFYPDDGSFGGGGSSNGGGGVQIPIQSFDRISARLHLDTKSAHFDPDTLYKMMAINMGFSTRQLSNLLIDSSKPSDTGTGWINLDLRSLAFEINDISDASLHLYFGDLSSSDAESVLITDRIGSAQNLILLKPDAVKKIAAASGAVYAVIDFRTGSANDSTRNAGSNLSSLQSSSQQYHPIVLEVFSFGMKGNSVVNNAMYRLELEETSRNSGIFEGTLEFAAANRLNIDDPDFIRELSPTSSNVKFIVLDSMMDDDGIAISYSDLATVGSIIPQSLSSPDTDIQTRSGSVVVSTPSGQLRFGTPVTVTLNDPDLNTAADTVEIYHTVNDARLPNVDTVGSGTSTLLEVKFKDIRYKRCIIDGVEHGGLASAGFSLVETGPATGVFKGVFKMPTWICDKSGSKLISTAGGSMDVIYYDALDSFGESSKFSLLRSLQNFQSSSSAAGHTGSISSFDHFDDAIENRTEDKTADTINDDAGVISTPPLQQEPFVSLSTEQITLQSIGSVKHVMLSGNVGTYVPGSIISIVLIPPGGETDAQTFDLRAGANGMYGHRLSFEGGVDLQGEYQVNVTRGDVLLDTLVFYVKSKPLVIPSQLKSAALEWSAGAVSDAEFAGALQLLMKTDIVVSSSNGASGTYLDGDTPQDLQNTPVEIPAWLGNVAGWWSAGLVSDAVFVQLIQYLLDAQVLHFGMAAG